MEIKDKETYFPRTFNEQMAWIDEKDGVYRELITDYEMPASGVTMPPYGFCYLKKLLPK